MLLAYLVLALATQRPPAVLQHFRSVATESIPGSLVAKIWSDRDESDCAQTFRTNGRAWTGDINDDGASEYVIFDGQSCGTLGCSYDLFESHRQPLPTCQPRARSGALALHKWLAPERQQGGP